MIIGLMFDSVGRKKPIVIFCIFGAITQFCIPFMSNVYMYYPVMPFLSFLSLAANNPYIPDLIEEKNQGVANIFRMFFMHISAVLSQVLILLNSTNMACFSSDVIFCFLGVLLLLAAVYVHCSMKDIVIEKKESESEPKTKTKEIVKEGMKSLYARPLLPMAIFGIMAIVV